MAKNVTRWSPDTCACEVDVITDSDYPEEHTIRYIKGTHGKADCGNLQ